MNTYLTRVISLRTVSILSLVKRSLIGRDLYSHHECFHSKILRFCITNTLEFMIDRGDKNNCPFILNQLQG